ncbi:MAG: acyl-CoA dehydrogenase family protein [Deltaproteobacteria bacterium]|nr:acyl-CoA dehydrogenase family protein [Deltaproteobacteria bacterium]
MPAVDALSGEAAALAGGLLKELQRPANPGEWTRLLAILNSRGWLVPGEKLPSPACAAAVMEGLTRGGMDPGVSLTLTVHYVMGFMVLRRLAPELLHASEPGLFCMGASEQGVGSHPGKISTCAAKDGEGFWTITGSKAFTTGGPVGTLFLVLAVCGEAPGGRDLGVFAVSRNTPGLTVTEMPLHGVTGSAPHGILTMEKVRVPSGSRLGPAGIKTNGWTEIVKPFRQWEDALMASWLAASVRRFSRELAGSAAGNTDRAAVVGKLVAAAEGLVTLARSSAASLDEEMEGADRQGLVPRRYGFFELLAHAGSLAAELEKLWPDPPAALRQITATAGSARFAARARAKIVATLAAG